MQVAHFRAPIIFLSQNVRAERRRRCEVQIVRPLGNIVIGIQNPAAQIEIGNDPSPRGEIPPENERIEARPVSGMDRLKNHEHGYSIQRDLKASLEKSRAIRTGEDPTVTNARIPDAGIRRAPGNRRPAARPYFKFVPAIFWPGLRPRQ